MQIVTGTGGVNQAGRVAADVALRFNELLLDSATASDAIRHWFGAADGTGAPLHAHVLHRQCPLGERHRAEIGSELAASWRSRTVVLRLSRRIVSLASLWYDAAALPPGMVGELETSRRPFGDVVGPLSPWRKSVGARVIADRGPFVLEHRAALGLGDTPFAHVLELYTDRLARPGRRA